MPVIIVPSSANVIIDGSLGKSFLLPLNQATTIQVGNLTPGEQYILTFVQDSVGGHAVTFPANVGNATAPNGEPNAQTKQIFDCQFDGTLTALAAATTA